MNVFDYLKMNADRPNHWESEPLSGKDVREILNELERMRARVAELEAVLRWYAGHLRPEDRINDNGERAIAALKS